MGVSELVVLLMAVQAVDPQEVARRAMEASVARQEASLDKQRDSVRKQAGAREPHPGEFFTVPWPAVAASVAPAIDCEPIPRAQVRKLIDDAARNQGLTPDLLRAVIDKESAFYPCAVSSKGAMGLMQLMPATAEQFGVDNPFDPKQNIDGGAKLLKQLLARYDNDLSLALGAYNAGPGRVDPQRGLPLIPETLNYVSDILDKLR